MARSGLSEALPARTTALPVTDHRVTCSALSRHRPSPIAEKRHLDLLDLPGNFQPAETS